MLRSIIDQIDSFEDFENNIREMDENTKSRMFELFVKFYLTQIPEFQGKRYCMHHEIPENLKLVLKLPKRYQGIRGLLMDDDEMFAVYVKFQSNSSVV